MGTYWYAVNLDKCEAVDPKRMGETPTWAGWVNDGPEGTEPSETYADGRVSLTRRWVHSLIAFGHWKYEDEIRLVSTEPEEGPALSVAWLGRRTDRAADYIGPEFPDADGRIDVWRDAPHPNKLKAPAPTLVPQDEEPLVMPADGPIRICNCTDRTPRPDDQHEKGCAYNPRTVDPVRAVEELRRRRSVDADDEPPASVEELLASHPGPWRIESVTPGAETIRVVDPLGQVVAVLPGPYYAAAQLLVIARETPFYTPTSGLGGGR